MYCTVPGDGFPAVLAPPVPGLAALPLEPLPRPLSVPVRAVLAAVGEPLAVAAARRELVSEVISESFSTYKLDTDSGMA